MSWTTSSRRACACCCAGRRRAASRPSELPADADDVDRVRATVDRYPPEVLAFVGKRAAQVALGRRTIACGPQPERFGGVETWVVPSTSGLAVRFWDIEPWRALAARTLI